jgi:hypothetical protein
MTTWSRRLPALALLVLLAAPTPALAQMGLPPEGPTPVEPPLPGGGTEMFRYLLHMAGVRPVRQEDVSNLRNRWGGDFSDLILVVIGHTEGFVGPYRTDDWMDRVSAGGGAVLFLSGTPNRYVNAPWARIPWSVTLEEGPVVAPRSAPTHQGVATCPFAIPVGPDEQLDPPRRPGPIWSLFAGLDRIATNSPGFFHELQRGPEFHYTLAKFPPGCQTQFRRPLPRDAALALGGEGPHPDSSRPFRHVAIADPSVFVNQLLADPETDNFELAKRMVPYLKDQENRDRRQCLFIENGRLISEFSTAEYVFRNQGGPRPPLPTPSQAMIVDIGNQIIDNMERNDALNRGLLGGDEERQNRRLRDVIAFLMALAAVAAVFTLVRRVWRSRQPTDVPNRPAAGPAAPADPAAPAGIFDRRQRELLRRDNVYEPVRDALREMFAAAGAPENPGPKLPRVEVADVVRRPNTLRNALTDLWKIAYGPPARLTVRRWEELEPLFLRALRAHADGKWRFETW